MKKLIIGGAAIAILGYLGVVGYLHQFDKENATQLLMENRYTGEQEKVAKALFDNSCQYCHSPNTPLPFYSKFPIVGGSNAIGYSKWTSCFPPRSFT